MAEVKLENAPQSVRPFCDKGKEALERNNFDYAMDMFETALEQEPRLLEIRRMLRSIAIQQARLKSSGKITSAKNIGVFMKASAGLRKKPLETIRLTEKLLRSDPLNVKYVKLQCDAAENAGLPEIAIQTLELLTKNAAADFSALSQLARLYRETEQFDLEFECREKIVHLKPTDSQALKELKDAAARLTMKKSDWQNTPGTASNKIESETSEKQTEQLMPEKRPEELIQSLEKQLQENPDDHTLRKKIQAAKEVLLNTRLAEAEDAEDDTTVSKLRKEWASLKISHALEETGRYPNDLQLKFELGKLYFNNEQFTEAIQQFQQAQNNPQRHIRSLIYLGKAFGKKGQNSIAADQFEKALGQLPDMDAIRKEVLYELGLLLLQLNRSEEALAHLKEIYTVDIGYKDVAKRIENSA